MDAFIASVIIAALGVIALGGFTRLGALLTACFRVSPSRSFCARRRRGSYSAAWLSYRPPCVAASSGVLIANCGAMGTYSWNTAVPLMPAGLRARTDPMRLCSQAVRMRPPWALTATRWRISAGRSRRRKPRLGAQPALACRALDRPRHSNPHFTTACWFDLLGDEHKIILVGFPLEIKTISYV